MNEELEMMISKVERLRNDLDLTGLEYQLTMMKLILGEERFDGLPYFVRLLKETSRKIDNANKETYK